jgi:succinate dehydrogenase/fumarate reductase cytochrome b subunit
MTGAAWIALTGDLPAAIHALKASSPLIVYPIKAAVAFPLVYHYLGGVRHIFWDKAKYGNQVCRFCYASAGLGGIKGFFPSRPDAGFAKETDLG